MASKPAITTSFIIENDENFRRGLERLERSTDDFRIPFTLISADFFKSNRKIFTLRSKGLYPDLAPATKVQKQKEVGFVYPILAREGALARSLTSPNASGAVNFIGRKELEMGTSVPHAIFHQSDEPRKVIPQRKVVFIDGGPNETAKDASIAGRSERWANIINDHILKLIEDF